MNFKRVFAVVGAPFLIATLFASIAPFEAMLVFMGIASLALIGSFFLVKKEFALLVKIAIIGVIISIGIYAFKYQFVATPVSNLAGQKAVIEATVTDIIKETAGSNGYKVTVTRHPFSKTPKQFKTNIYTPNALDIAYYDNVTLEVEFFEISNISTVDIKKIYLSDNIHIFGYAQKAAISDYSPPVMSPLSLLRMAKAKLCQTLDLSLDLQTSALCKALLLGDTSSIDDLTSYRLANVGVIHIASVSGLHVTVIAGLMILILSLFGLKKRAKAVVVIGVVWAFVALTGFSISAIRAGVMLTVLQLGVMFHEKADGLNSLFISALIIILINPFAINDVGFLLTFSCTFGIVTLAPTFSKILKNAFSVTNNLIATLIDSLSITLCVTLCCLPILIDISKGFNIATPLVNFYAIPLTGILVPLIIMFLLLSPVPLLANIVGVAIELLCSMFLSSIEWVSGLDFLFVGLDYPIIGLVISCAACVLVYCVIRLKKAISYVLFIVIAFIVFTPIIYRIATYGNHVITTFSSYSGSYIVSEYRGKATVVILTSDKAIGTSIAKFLSGHNITIIESVILLEQESSSYNGISTLLELKQVESIFINSENKLSEKIECTRLIPDKKSDVTGEVKANANTAFIKVNSAPVVITTSDKEAAENKCEILFFHKKTLKETKQFNAKCVILLNRCVDSYNEGVLNADIQQLEFNISSSGEITSKRK